MTVVNGQLSTVGSAALVAEWADGVVQEVSLSTTASRSEGAVTPYLRGVQRPVALLVGAQSVLDVGDWATGRIYRVAVD